MRKILAEYSGMLLGALFITVGLYFFWLPSQLAAGGISGLSIVIKAILPFVPIGVIILVLDIFMFAIGFVALGKSFGLKSIICSLEIAFLMVILEFLFPDFKPLSKDVLVVLLFGALFIAIGQAIVFNLEASSGGTDIIAKIIARYSGLNIGTALVIADMTIVLLAIGIFGFEKGLYAVLGVIVTSTLIDYIISGINVQKFVTIIPSSCETTAHINTYILHTLDRGATIYHAEGAYSKEKKTVITTVMDRREFIELKRHIAGIDALAFVTVQNLHEVVGEGFKR
ncbi:YitT family protein [Cellulosilyticum sp. I15G10I2]|uniref:YitT family protein n=1 Tax=Cellulosilyticum sp. I15G10I2 TaxID=1892843 RepID=UPI00085BEBF9|nr:YitT family protein [Cellulosilyticum sp. I15G10I2]